MQTWRINLFIFLIAFLFSSYNSNATQIKSKSDGLWHLTSTWVGGVIPGPTDSVLIQGHRVTISDLNLVVERIHLTNFDVNTQVGSMGSLELIGSTNLVTNGEFYAQGEGKNAHVLIYVTNTANLEVNGHFNIQRMPSNADDFAVQLQIEMSAKVVAKNGFLFNYHNSDANESWGEIILKNDGILDITGHTELYNQNGNQFLVNSSGDAQFIARNDLTAELFTGGEILFEVFLSSELIIEGNASFTNSGGSDGINIYLDFSGDINLDGDLMLYSSAPGKKIHIEATPFTNVNINIGGNLGYYNSDPQTIEIILNGDSELQVGGNIHREFGHGQLTMSPWASLILNGTGVQNIPATTTPFGIDSFHVTNLVLENTGDSLVLDGELMVTENLELTEGLIITTEQNLLILDDQVNITGGSSTSYIDGPVKKVGRNGGQPFTFPVGNNGIYAPLTISAVIQAESEYQAQYFRTATPAGTFDTGLENVSTLEYWAFDITPGTGFVDATELVDVTLGWDDATNSGIGDLNDLVVARYDGDYDNEIGTWLNTGNGGTTGSAGSGQSGTLTHDNSCPPPCCHSIITYGSISTNNPLPIELQKLNAKKTGHQVQLDWVAITDIDFDHFEIERSNDAINFKTIDNVPAKESNTSSKYQTFDVTPISGSNYYRLKMIDLSGQILYSEIKSVFFEVVTDWTIFPNPVKEEFQILGIDIPSGLSKLEVFNQSGKLMYSGNHHLGEAASTFSSQQINIAQSGIYFICISNNSKTSVVRFIKE